MKTSLIYKIVTADQWEVAERKGRFTGAPVDIDDGYIHFSTAQTVRETAAKHFSGQADLLLVAVEETKLGSALKYEVSRGGLAFPHLYGELDLSDVVWVQQLPLGDDQLHVFPEGFS